MNPTSLPLAWDLVADAYSTHIAPVLERYAAHALEAARLPAASRIIDVATGPGTLALLAARAGHRVVAVDFSPGMIAALQRQITVEPIEARVGDGTALPFADREFDAGFSMFGIMLFDDRARGLAELHRVLRPGGIGVISSWRPMQERPLFAAVFGALREMLPAGDPPAPQGLSSPDDCRREMEEAGFVEVETMPLSDAIEAESFEEMWRWFPPTCAPLALLQQRLGPQWNEIERGLRERALETVGAGPQRMEMPALITLGRRRA